MLGRGDHQTISRLRASVCVSVRVGDLLIISLSPIINLHSVKLKKRERVTLAASAEELARDNTKTTSTQRTDTECSVRCSIW